MAGLVKRFGDDLSKCDFIAAQKLASRGRSAEEIGKAMAEASPALAERKPGHEADYIERTVSKVMGLPSVQLRGPSWHGHRHPASEAWTGAGQISACSACVGTHACYTMSTHAQKGVLWNTKKALQGRST